MLQFQLYRNSQQRKKVGPLTLARAAVERVLRGRNRREALLDAGLTRRLHDRAARRTIVRPARSPVDKATTDLESSRAVTAATNTAPKRNDSRPFATPEPATRVDIARDRKADTATDPVVDARTGRTIAHSANKPRTDFAV